MYAVTTVLSSMHSCLVVHGEYCFLDVTDHLWFLQSSQGLRVSTEKLAFFNFFFNIKAQTQGPYTCQASMLLVRDFQSIFGNSSVKQVNSK